MNQTVKREYEYLIARAHRENDLKREALLQARYDELFPEELAA